jgi:hypothetical protein
MTTMPPSPFLSPAADPVLRSAEAEAVAQSDPAPDSSAAPDALDLASECGHIHEIFYHGNLLCAEARRAGRVGYAAVEAEVHAWMDEQDPSPIFLREGWR